MIPAGATSAQIVSLMPQIDRLFESANETFEVLISLSGDNLLGAIIVNGSAEVTVMDQDSKENSSLPAIEPI